MTIAIEPMICQYGCKIKTLADGWTVKTKDGGLAAHFEHSVAILKDRTEIMTIGWEDPQLHPVKRAGKRGKSAHRRSAQKPRISAP